MGANGSLRGYWGSFSGILGVIWLIDGGAVVMRVTASLRLGCTTLLVATGATWCMLALPGLLLGVMMLVWFIVVIDGSSRVLYVCSGGG